MGSEGVSEEAGAGTARVKLIKGRQIGFALLEPHERHYTVNEARRALIEGKVRLCLDPQIVALAPTHDWSDFLHTAAAGPTDCAEKGNVFLFDGPFDYTTELAEEALARIKSGQVRMPFSHFSIIIDRPDSELGLPASDFPPIIITAAADDEGRPGMFTTFSILRTDEPNRVGMLLTSFAGRITYKEDGAVRLEAASTLSEEALSRACGMFWALCAALLMLADQRVRVEHKKPEERLLRARRKQGKPEPRAFWSLSARALPPEYRTAVHDSSPDPQAVRSSTHASPIPHSRRGHSRRLQGGRVIWVRSCTIRGFDGHINRGRDFYSFATSTQP